MQIHELPSATPGSGQYLAVDDGAATYKIDYDALAAAIIAQAGLGTAAGKAVANNLTTDIDGYVLDARQGKALQDELDALGDAADADVANNVTTAESGYVLDARQGKALNEAIAAVSDALNTLSGNIGAAASKNVANNLTTTNSGYVLDARQGNALGGRLSSAEDDIDNIESALGFFSLVNKNAPSNSTTNITVPNSCRCLAISIGAAASVMGVYLISATTGGSLTISTLHSASGLALSSSANNRLTVVNSASYTPTISFLAFTSAGNVS